MAFEAVGASIPTEIKALTITLQRQQVGVSTVNVAWFQIDITNQDGIAMPPVSGNLFPHCTAGELSALDSFMTGKWQQAQAVLPESE